MINGMAEMRLLYAINWDSLEMVINLWMPSDPSLVNCTFISGAINGSSYFSDEVFNTLTFGRNCKGTENNITECPRHTAESSCGTHSDAHVICQGD